MKKLYSTENRVLLYLLKSKLEEENIYCVIKNENPPLAGEIPPVIAWPEIWVVEEQYHPALHILQTELTKSSTPTKAWQCHQCKEHIEGQFDLCWQCGNSKTT